MTRYLLQIRLNPGRDAELMRLLEAIPKGDRASLIRYVLLAFLSGRFVPAEKQTDVPPDPDVNQ